MYNPNDNEIDRLSREAAEHYNAPGAPSWEAMRQALDKELPQEKEKKRRGFLFFFLLAAIGFSVAGSAIWYGIRMHNNIAAVDASANKKPIRSNDNTITAAENTTPIKSNPIKELNVAPIAGPASAQQKTNTAEINTATNKTTNNTSFTNKSVAGSKTITQNKIASDKIPVAVLSFKNKVDANTTHSNTLPAGKIVNKKSTALGGTKNNDLPENKTFASANASINKKTSSLKKQKNIFTDGSVVTNSADKRHKLNKLSAGKSVNDKNIPVVKDTKGNDVATENSTDTGSKENTGSDNNSTEPVMAIVPDVVIDKNAVAKDSVTPAPVAVVPKKDSAKNIAVKKKSKSKNEKAILLGLTGGLDLSTVKFSYGSNVGYNIGLMGGYQFSKHWSAYTGFVYTKKNYKLNGGDYHPPEYYWTNWVNLQTVEGYCRMWELPVQVRYTFNPSAKTAVFASAGVSSYFMKQQEYDYTYKTGTGPMTTPWADDKNLNHIFSILDLSAGFTKPIGKHMNWQVEPYAKIPLGGVGFGNIKLSSFGLNLTVQYKHLLKR